LPDQPEPLVDDAIASIAPYEPGKPIDELERELGHAWGDAGAIKLASNENPVGPSPRGIAAAQAALAEGHRYPDGGAYALRKKLAAFLTRGSRGTVGERQIMVGAGSNEIIDLLVQALCVPGDEVLAPRYSFVAYKLAAEKNRHPFREAPVTGDLQYDIDAILNAVTNKTKVLFFANPNNPTGAYARRENLEKLVERLPPRVVLAVDEAYFEYAIANDYPDTLQYLNKRERIVVLRTFSKVYGLAGLRVGYGVSHQEVWDYVNRLRLPFNVSSPAQAAALAALDDGEHVARARAANDIELPRLARALEQLGLAVLPSQTNFVLVSLGARDGRQIYDKLLHKGVIVRPMNGYGLPHHLRITVGTAAENARLVDALTEVL
jgi:histidinol-phosphate aminotransferase